MDSGQREVDGSLSIPKRHCASLTVLSIVFGAGLSWGVACADAGESTPEPGPKVVSPWTLASVLARIPPLRHPLGNRWPLVPWMPLEAMPDGQSFAEGKPLSEDAYRQLHGRALTPSVRLNERYIPMALALQRAGCPVIIVDGMGGQGPGAQAPDALHKFEAGFTVQKGQPVYPCTFITTGWDNHAAGIRATLRKFREAGVTVNAAWLDYEVEPFPADFSRWRQAKCCLRCQRMFPKGALETPFAHARCVWLFRQQLYSKYIAEPILEVFPQCSVGNYDGVFSSEEHPAWTVWGAVFPPMEIGSFTVSMPDVYGSDAMFNMFWYGGIFEPLRSDALTRFLRHRSYRGSGVEKTDRVYTHVMLAQVSADAANRQKAAPRKGSVPYVGRVVQDADPGVFLAECTMGLVGNPSGTSQPLARPILSRNRYREILRHVWLRGVTTMVVFNAFMPKDPDFCVQEVEDAVAVYDEMLAYRDFLDRGVVMNTAIPAIQDTGAIWSGLRREDEAIVRAFTQGDQPALFRVRPWSDAPEVELVAKPDGTTYRVKRNGQVMEN